MISIWHRTKPPWGEEVLAVTPKAHEYTNIGQVKRQGLVNVFELRNGGFVFLSEVKMWCRLPRDYRNKKSEYVEDNEDNKNWKYKLWDYIINRHPLWCYTYSDNDKVRHKILGIKID